MKKLCICLSGQVRNDRYSLITLRESLNNLKEIEVTTIFSVWETTGQKIDGSIHLDQVNRIFDPSFVDFIPLNWYGKNFWNYFPKTYQKLQEFVGADALEIISEIFPDAIIDIENNNLLDLEFEYSRIDKNSKKMLYKIWRCNEIKKGIESKKGTFDYVIRMRPDFIIKQIKVPNNTNNIIQIPGVGNRENFLMDTFAFGSSKAIDYYASLFGESLGNNFPFVHKALYNHLAKSPYHVQNPVGFKFEGFSKNKLLSWSDLSDDFNEFYQELYTITQEIENHQFDKASMQLEILYEKIDIDEYRQVYFMFFHEFLLKINKEGAAQKALIIAYLSIFPNFFTDQQYLTVKQFFFNKITPYFSKHKFFSYKEYINDLKKQSENIFIDNLFLLSEITKQNISEMLKTKYFIDLHNKIRLEKYIFDKEYDNIKELALKENLQNLNVELLKKEALKLEASNLNEALKLMKLAFEMRPSGSFIIKKIKEYETRLNII